MRLIKLFSWLIFLLLFGCAGADTYHQAQQVAYSNYVEAQKQNKSEVAFIPNGATEPVKITFAAFIEPPNIRQAQTTDWGKVATTGIVTFGATWVLSGLWDTMSTISAEAIAAAGGGNITADNGASVTTNASHNAVSGNMSRDTITKTTKINTEVGKESVAEVESGAEDASSSVTTTKPETPTVEAPTGEKRLIIK
jgi:hypothetical protein